VRAGQSAGQFLQLFVEQHGLKEKLTGVNEAHVVTGILA